MRYAVAVKHKGCPACVSQGRREDDECIKMSLPGWECFAQGAHDTRVRPCPHQNGVAARRFHEERTALSYCERLHPNDGWGEQAGVEVRIRPDKRQSDHAK